MSSPTPTQGEVMSEREDLIATAITMAFGKRCEDFGEFCPCCIAWKQYDEVRTSADKAQHFEDHFQKLARVYGPANAALDTARREWAKRGEKA